MLSAYSWRKGKVFCTNSILNMFKQAGLEKV